MNNRQLQHCPRSLKCILIRLPPEKREFIENAAAAFGEEKSESEPTESTDNLFQQIGQLKVENDFFKKSLRKASL